MPSRLQGRGRPWRPETRLHHMRCTTIQFRDFQSDSDDSSLPHSSFPSFPSTSLRSWLRPRELPLSLYRSLPTSAQNGRIEGPQFYHHCISACLLNKTIRMRSIKSSQTPTSHLFSPSSKPPAMAQCTAPKCASRMPWCKSRKRISSSG